MELNLDLRKPAWRKSILKNAEAVYDLFEEVDIPALPDAMLAKGAKTTLVWNESFPDHLLIKWEKEFGSKWYRFNAPGNHDFARELEAQTESHYSWDLAQLMSAAKITELSKEIDMKGKFGYSLYTLVWEMRQDRALALIKAGADVEYYCAENDATTLTAAIGYRQTNIVRALLKAGADPERVVNGRSTASFAETERMHPEIVSMIEKAIKKKRMAEDKK